MDLTMHLVVFLSVIFAVILEPRGISAAPKNNDAPLSYRHLFQRDPGKRLSARPARQYHESTIEACASACVMETSFLCKSFDLDNTLRSCELFSVSLDDPDVQLIAADDIDHYRTTYEKQFIRLPHHKLTDRHDLRQVDISVEGCARLCMLETQFKCQGFDYDVIRRHCWLSQMTSENIGGATPREQWDYYSRAPVGVLSKFMNYGHGQLKLLQAGIYDASVLGVSLNNCADLCLGQTNFRCVSFDYTYNGPDQSLCKMSKHLAANVYGLVRNHGHRTLHYERIEPSMMNFYSTPYSLLRTSPEKVYALITPSLCAQKCLKEEAFVCRSFNYITESGVCQLSTKTGSDVGGLFTQSNRQIHHFELKPILDCGGNFTDDKGNFASPNWPRNYAHNEDCAWHIAVPAYKVVKFYFTYLELAVDPHEPCNENSDRVIITEHTLTTSRSFCVTPRTKTFIARSNNVTVTFKSNTYTDGQGFRVFYNAEWTCDVHLHSSSGQIASTGFPANYKSSTTCSWRITAPHNYRVIVNFSHFELEQNVLGHCNERHDRVILLDGGTVSSPLIGLYCGVHTEEFSVKSSGMDIFIQFQSDEDTEAQGFHAYYEFESQNGTLYKALPGEIQGPGGVVPLDAATGEDIIEHTYGENGMLVASAKKHMQTDELSPHINRLGIGYRSISGGASRSPVNHAYRTTMWAVLSVLLLLLVSALIVIVLVWRHFKRQLHKLTSQTQNHEELPAEEVPLQDTRFHKQCNNEVALPAVHKPSPVCGATVDTSSATARYTNSPLFTDTTVDKDNRINEKNVNNIKT